MPFDQRTLLAVIGVLLLAVGFTGGYLVGSSRAPAAPRAAAGPATGTLSASASAGGGTNHTFNGVQAPPHSEESHVPMRALLAGSACPCGDCTDQLMECECDVAVLIRGTTAHLFTRGLAASEVADQMRQQFHIEISDAAIAAADQARPSDSQGLAGADSGGPTSDSGLQILDALGGEPPK